VIISLEGPDRAGKSTLARLLVQEHEACHPEGTAAIWHEGPPPEGVNLVARYELPLLLNREKITSEEHLVVLDRWETGELIYGPLLRGRSGLSPGQALHVDLLLHSLAARRYLVNPGMFHLDARHDERPDELIKKDQLLGLVDFYEAYAARHHWNIIRTTDAGILPWIYEPTHTQPRELARQMSHFPGYVGWLVPKVLLVGDRRSNYLTRPDLGTVHWNWGAFTPTAVGGSSRWLLDSLERLPELPALGLCNSVEHGQDLAALWRQLGEPAVLALGLQADLQLNTVGIEHATVTHPQHARRFRSKHPEEYDMILREGIERALSQREERRSGVQPAPGPGGEPRPPHEPAEAAG
jgi:hypothetical protein